MTKKENKKGNQVVREMKECFRSFHLPVKKNKDVESSELAFTSQLYNDHVCAEVSVIYDRQMGYAGFNIFFLPPVPSEKVPEILRFSSLLNGTQLLYRYSVCQCSNLISLQTGIYTLEETLIKSKYKRLIRTILEESYRTFPAFMEVMDGENFRDVGERLIDDHEDYLLGTDSYTETMKERILDDVKETLADEGINFNDTPRDNDAYVKQFQYPAVPGLNFILALAVQSESETLALSMSATFTVPDDREDIIMDLVNKINRACRGSHMYFSHEKKNVVLLSGIMLENGSLDKAELKRVFPMFVGNGFRMIPIVYEQLTSAASLETLILKALGSCPGTEACVL